MKISTCIVLLIGLILAGFVGCKPGDTKIRTAINYKFQDQPGLALVTINVANGIVTLDGMVNIDSERAEAMTIARNTNGVDSVINQIIVNQANSLTSDIIRDEILIEETDLILKGYPGVKETVSSGVITLTGPVSAQKKPVLLDTIRTLFPSDINDQLTIK